jgi:hypothetical protein
MIVPAAKDGLQSHGKMNPGHNLFGVNLEYVPHSAGFALSDRLYFY